MGDSPSSTPMADFLLVARILPPFIFLLWGMVLYVGKNVIWEEVMGSRWPWQKD